MVKKVTPSILYYLHTLVIEARGHLSHHKVHRGRGTKDYKVAREVTTVVMLDVAMTF